MSEITSRADSRQKTGLDILSDLKLLELWGRFGDPVIVGAVAYGLVVAPDIDMEIFCEEPRINDGFAVLAACSTHPKVKDAGFSNHLHDEQALYWRLGYLHDDGQLWKIDMWSCRPREVVGVCGANLVDPLRKALTEPARETILRLKEEILAQQTFKCPSLQIYRAVLDHGVNTSEELREWVEQNPVVGVIDWKPGRET